MWNLWAKINRLYSDRNLSDGWIYPDIGSGKQNFEERKNSQKLPKLQQNFFIVEPTHAITIYPYNEEKIKFLILCYGFLKGVYLSPAGYLCMNKVPYNVGKLSGAILVENDAMIGIKCFSGFYETLGTDNRKLLFAILHWYLIGQTYCYAWDRFDAQYKVLDAIFKLSDSPRMPHTKRPTYLANRFGLQVPDWAQLGADQKSTLSITRNALSHEAIYASEPIGYAYPKENFDLELTRFNEKLIAALVGLTSSYISSNPHDRQMHGWKFS